MVEPNDDHDVNLIENGNVLAHEEQIEGTLAASQVDAQQQANDEVDSIHVDHFNDHDSSRNGNQPYAGTDTLDANGSSTPNQTINDSNGGHHNEDEQRAAGVVAASDMMENKNSSKNVSMQCICPITHVY